MTRHRKSITTRRGWKGGKAFTYIWESISRVSWLIIGADNENVIIIWELNLWSNRMVDGNECC